MEEQSPDYDGGGNFEGGDGDGVCDGKNAEGGTDNAMRPSQAYHRRRSSGGGLSRNGSARSVSCSAKTIKVGSGLRTFGGSGNTLTTNNSSSRSQSMRQSLDRFRQVHNTLDSSFRSYVSDLDIESAADMAAIGEGSHEDELKRMPGMGPQETDVLTSDEMYVSAEFTLASESNHFHPVISSKNSVGNNSKGSRSRSLVSSNDNDGMSSAEFHDNSSVVSTSIMMDKTRAENVGRSGTRYVYVVLMSVGIILAILMNFGARRIEYKNFELEFRSFARETADLAETNADHTFSQLQTMATTVTSEGMLERERNNLQNTGSTGSWPNVTIPHFDQRIADFSESFGAIMLLYVPLVEAKDRVQWEHYANEHSPWNTTTSSSSSNITDNQTHLHIHQTSSLHIGDTRDDFFDVESFVDDVLMNQGGFEDPRGISAPIYQYGGPGHQRSEKSESDIALMDLWTHPIFKKEVIASIEYDVPVISEYLDVSFLRDALSVPDIDGENSASLWSSMYSVYSQENNDANSSKPVDMILRSIRSLTLHPVKETFEPDARTIGFIVGVVPWHTYFQNILKSSHLTSSNASYTKYGGRDVNGIVVKVESDCGSVFTFVLNSRKGTSRVRLGDWREQYEKYEYLNHSSRFFWKDHPQGQSRHCHFDLHIYPNDEFRDEYRTVNSWYYSGLVAGIFLFTAFLFACYDHFIFKGQRIIVHEATGMIVENARRAARNERELNDFIAHEVRNPLAAAISACSFVSSAITEDQGRFDQSMRTIAASNGSGESERLALIVTDDKRKEVQDDINIIDSSLHFINDLLRNMLDMQRAGSNQIHINIKPTNIMDDIFKPVEAMMHLRDVPYKVIMEVDSGLNSGDDEDDNQLVVMTDPMRLKQVLLNLTRNASKFVEKGFIRCSASVNPINGFVELRVDDSGPGIAPEKRSQVFGKFQESLDLLQQGTGIGLSLCKKMIDMMNGCLFIDEDYNSGIKGCKGTRFVIQLKIPPLQLNKIMFEPELSSIDRARLRRRHLLACSEQPNPEQRNSSDTLTESINSCVTFNSKECRLGFENEAEGEMGTRVLDPVPYTSESTHSAIDENMVEDEMEDEDKKEGMSMLPLPTALRLTPTGEVIPNDSAPETIEEQIDQPGSLKELPKNLSVLFVDDDMVLRKLFSRTLKKINPTWSCKEASSGEMAIELISSTANRLVDDFDDEQDSQSFKEEGACGFDLIFMDQYMASVQKQLLGTETVRKIRAKGYHKAIICGLSANDVEDAFYSAGSDAFMFKPFPCKKDELEKELLKVMNSRVRRH